MNLEAIVRSRSYALESDLNRTNHMRKTYFQFQTLEGVSKTGLTLCLRLTSLCTRNDVAADSPTSSVKLLLKYPWIVDWS